MHELETTLTQKGQVTIPSEIRAKLGLKPRDKVRFLVEGDSVKLTRAGGSIQDFYQSVPALSPARSWKEIEEIAHEERAQEAAQE